MRVDKFIWAVRLYKTRSLASKECRQNRVIVNDELVKPARDIRVDDEITIKKGAIYFSYKVIGFPKSRVGAKLVPEYIKDITPAEEIEKMELIKQSYRLDRDRGTGRPTKRERRAINKFLDDETEDTE